MKFIFVLLACFLCLGLLNGCSAGCSGIAVPDMVLKWPVEFQNRPATMRGPDYIVQPQVYAPSYTPVAQPTYSAPCAPPVSANPCP